MSDFHVLVVWVERASIWSEVVSSFDAGKLDGVLLHLRAADVVAKVVTCADDSDPAIALVVDSLLAPSDSFAGRMDAVETLLVEQGSVERCVQPRLVRRRKARGALAS